MQDGRGRVTPAKCQAAVLYDRVMRGRWVVLSVAIVLAGIAAGALSLRRREPPAVKRSPALAAPVVAPGSEVSLPGKIQAQHVISVGAQTAGDIESFAVDSGQEVYEGQLLARISNGGLETAHEMAQTAVENTQNKVNNVESAIIAARLEASRARADANRARGEFDRLAKIYQRQKILVGEGATPRLAFEKSEREYESAKSEFDSLDEIARQAEERVTKLMQDLQSAKRALEEKKKQLEEAKAALTATEVHSPVSGIVVGRKGEAGKPLPAESEDLFQIAVDLELLEVVLDPEPPLLKRIRPQQQAVIVVADLPGEGISAALAKHPVFPVMIIRMITAGEQTGKLENMLERISDFLDDEIETTLSGLTALIEPLLIVFLGVTAGGIAICMFLPIFKMADIINPQNK